MSALALVTMKMGLERVNIGRLIELEKLPPPPDFVYQELQATLRPLWGQREVGEAGLGQGEHRDDQVQVGEEAEGDDAAHSGQTALNSEQLVRGQ